MVENKKTDEKKVGILGFMVCFTESAKKKWIGEKVRWTAVEVDYSEIGQKYVIRPCVVDDVSIRLLDHEKIEEVTRQMKVKPKMHILKPGGTA